MDIIDNEDDVRNVCRLCSSRDNLIMIFDDCIEIPKNMKDVIQMTTGVKISPFDDISQKLCYKCINITIRMFKFRSISNVNDMGLKEKAATTRKRGLVVHRSIQSVLDHYPNLVLPSSISALDISPVIKIDKHEVHEWKTKYRQEREYENTPGNAMKESTERVKESAKPKAVEVDVAFSGPETDVVLIEDDSPSCLHDKDKVLPPKDHTLNSNNKKRKLNLLMNEQDTKKAKLNSDHCESEDILDSLLTIKYVNESIFICDICNNISYNLKDLKKHKNKHMRCSLCKKSFRTLRDTGEHSAKYCPIKHMMDNLPYVRLQRCELSDDLRKRYPSALEKIYRNISTNSIPLRQANARLFDDGKSLITDGQNAKSNGEPRFVNKEIHGVDMNKPSENTPDDAKCFTWKPNLEMTGENVLNFNLDNEELSLIRSILKQTNNTRKTSSTRSTRNSLCTRDSSTQTDIPNNFDIIPSLERDKLFEMICLRRFLQYYKIPVNLIHSTQISAKYNTDPLLVSKYRYYLWSVIKTQKKSDISNTNNKEIIAHNKTAIYTIGLSKIGSSTNAKSHLISAKRTQSRVQSQKSYGPTTKNVQTCSRIPLIPTDPNNRKECYLQDKSINTNLDFPEDNIEIPNRAHENNANVQNCGISIENNIEIKRTNIVQNIVQVQQTTSFHKTLNRSVVMQSTCQLQMMPEELDNIMTGSMNVSRNNEFFNNASLANLAYTETPIVNITRPSQFVKGNNGISCSKQSDVLNRSNLSLTNLKPPKISNSADNKKQNDSGLAIERINLAPSSQKYAVTTKSKSPVESANIEGNCHHVVKTKIGVSTNSYIAMPATKTKNSNKNDDERNSDPRILNSKNSPQTLISLGLFPNNKNQSEQSESSFPINNSSTIVNTPIRTINEQKSDSVSPGAISSKWNSNNHYAPLIRVKNVSELT